VGRACSRLSFLVLLPPLRAVTERLGPLGTVRHVRWLLSNCASFSVRLSIGDRGKSPGSVKPFRFGYRLQAQEEDVAFCW
jgi:hypothetical protein